MRVVKALQVKVRPQSYDWLNLAAIEVNQVWNYCAETCDKAIRRFAGPPRYLSHFDLTYLLKGASKEFRVIPQSSISEVAREYAQKRRKAKSTRLRWRRSFGSKRSLGWVPFRTTQVEWKDGGILFKSRIFRVFDSYGLHQYRLRGGSFAQNALGEWFLNVLVEVEVEPQELPAKAIGIDLGLKTVATCSDGSLLEAGRFYRDAEAKLANAQRRGHKRQAKRIHRQAANRRKDAIHKFTTQIVKDCGAIYVGDVSSSALAKTRMAKSILDSGWYMLKQQLIVKSHRAGRICEVVDESYTTRACNACGSLSGPKGVSMLVVREWTCSDCGAEHQRDVNAARNILAAGLGRPASGTAEQCR